MLTTIAAAAILALANLCTCAAFSPSPSSAQTSSCHSLPWTRQTHLSATPESVVIGGGRIGSLLATEGAPLLGRDDSLASAIDPEGSGPIFVATRNDVLSDVVAGCPAPRRKDLVFLQNGYLDEFLSGRGLSANTQALLYLSVTAKGVAPVDGITAVNPEGLTAATGPHAEALAAKLAALGLKCNVVSAEEYRPAMFEKMM